MLHRVQEYQIHLWAELGWYTSQVSATKAFNNRSFFCAYDARDQNGSEDRSENTRECIHCAWEPVLPYVQTHAMHSDIVELKEGFKRSGCVSIVFVIRVGTLQQPLQGLTISFGVDRLRTSTDRVLRLGDQVCPGEHLEEE